MAFTSLNQLDVIFISYDEANCEENWADLENKVPWAKRVHGVRGSDASHKAAANLSETDMFISVDADNIVDPSFFDLELEFDHPKFANKAISFAAENTINGLIYGNGGLKIWPKPHLLRIKSHEAADASDDNLAKIEFCGDDSYVQMVGKYCTTYPNGSPRQAFRAGFREGVKMSLNSGNRIDRLNFEKQLWYGNYKRLITWCSVGADVDNGLWAIYGARYGCWLTNLTDWDYINVRDFEHINDIWKCDIAREFDLSDYDRDPLDGSDVINKCYKTNFVWSETQLKSEIARLGEVLRKELGLDIAELDPIQSKFYKKSYMPAPRMNKYLTEKELQEIRRING